MSRPSWWCKLCKSYHSHGDVPANCADRPNLAKAPTAGGGFYYGPTSSGSLQRIDDSMRRMDARWGWLDRIVP